jgi:tetratricopeptide (TPR) repeat protein
MLHVKQIEKFVDDSKNEEAHEALDQLLSLGPQNTAALKLRARLFEYEGRFAQEAKIWERIATIDNEDEDAIDFLLNRQMEDREHFYFTDDIPGGGRRFMAYPRTLVHISALGLAGCLLFLIAVRFAATYPLLQNPVYMLGMFAAFVVAPSLTVIITYFRSLKSVSISHVGFEVATRTKIINYKWHDIERVCLARWEKRDIAFLSLVMIPKDRTQSILEINMNHGRSSIKARTYLVSEIARSFSEPEHTTRESLGLDANRIVTF